MDKRYEFNKPQPTVYKTAQFFLSAFTRFVFKREFIRNEIRELDGAFAVIANHEAAYDFASLVGATEKPLRFVISNSFYNSLPVKRLLDKIGVIPKQQFQTSITDMRRIKEVIESGEGLVIYPAGLMCEDGVSTPIPQATYKFLKWLDTDIYAARTMGTYFTMPKWQKGMRPGKTYMDIYKLIGREELKSMSIAEIKEKTDKALLFDAYREQEKLLVKYKNNDNIEGLQNVLYKCPNCGAELTMNVREGNIIYCTECGFAEKSDEYGFLHKISEVGEELRYVSDWSGRIFSQYKEMLGNDPDYSLSARTSVFMLDYEKHCYKWVGLGTVSIDRAKINITGRINGEELSIDVPSEKLPTLPFKPGRDFDVQKGSDIYRCVLSDGRLAMKFVNTVKAFFELNPKNR